MITPKLKQILEGLGTFYKEMVNKEEFARSIATPKIFIGDLFVIDADKLPAISVSLSQIRNQSASIGARTRKPLVYVITVKVLWSLIDANYDVLDTTEVSDLIYQYTLNNLNNYSRFSNNQDTGFFSGLPIEIGPASFSLDQKIINEKIQYVNVFSFNIIGHRNNSGRQ